MEFHVISDIKYENENHKIEHGITVTNLEEVIFISIHELKIKLLKKFKINNDNLTVIINNYKLNTKNKKIIIKAKCEKFDDWEIISN
jgi:hypothetical protein